MADKKFDVDKDEDGRLIADGWCSFLCADCGGFHIELCDKNDETFAVLTIEPEDVAGFAVNLMKVAAELMKRGSDSSMTCH